MSILKHCDCGIAISAGTIIHASSDCCPLAELIAQGFGADGAVVSRTETVLVTGDVAERYLTSPELLALICHFEETGEVREGEYSLLPPKLAIN